MGRAEDYAAVAEFRNRLVAYMNNVLSAGGNVRWGGLDEDDARRLQSEQPWLAQEYGRLYDVINRWGGMSMGSPALGITSHDVIQDAIHDIGDFSYNDIARLSVQHLDTVLGRLRAEAEEEHEERIRPDDLYRLTSPVFWLGRLVALPRWLLTTRTRIIGTVIGAVTLAIIGGIVSGAAQAWFERVFLSRP